MHGTDDDSGHGSLTTEPLVLDASSGARIKVPERFVLYELLGRGGSGAVFRAYDRVRGGTVAVKFLTVLDPASLFRFKSEFRRLSTLSHPNLVQLYDMLAYESEWMFTMELVEGTDFLRYVRPRCQDDGDTEEILENAKPTLVDSEEGMLDSQSGESSPWDPPTASEAGARRVAPFDEPRLRSAFLQLCEGLHALHRAHLLHRDLKPANVLVSTSEGRVVICDFGLALEGNPRGDGSDLLDEESSSSTRFEGRHREIAGTLPFMSPEQAKAEALTSASDWYSVGVMLYQALTGRVPFKRSLSYSSALRAKLQLRPIHPARLLPTVPPELAELALAMLHPDPRRRGGYVDAIAALEGNVKRGFQPAPASPVFFGRDTQTKLLSAGFAASRGGLATVALVSGLSGMGKSSLVHHFLARLEDEENAVVLRARCYEREELPYKALDPLIDALSSHLIGLDPELVFTILPATIHFLAALFPALRRVPAIADLRDSDFPVTDPRERRRLAFRALRELCKKLALLRPLVFFIDDLQWGDLDSAILFQELFASSDAPAVLLVCAYRSEDEQRSPLLALLRDGHSLDKSALRILDVPVGPLARADAVQLAMTLLGDDPAARQAAELIAGEAEGSPFFVRELAAYVSEHGIAAASRVRLDALVKAQLDSLVPESRALLSVIAVAGRPVAHATVRAASGLEGATFKALRDLEARRLVLTTRSRVDEQLECQHDRIRETVCQLLTGEVLRSLHRALAEALEQGSLEDCDALLEHWRGAGEREKAAGFAVRGAQKAETALAFARAADLYRDAVSLVPEGDPRRRDLRERLGHALILAGRGLEAAEVFLALLPGASQAQALTYRMLATTQLLRGGELVAGFAELARADDLFGVRFPKSEAKALVMLVTRKVRIRLKLLTVALDDAGRESEERGARLDALWEVAAAVTSADFLRGGVYSAELMLRAMEARDPSHVAGACGLEAIVAAASNDPTRAQEMIDIAEEAGRVSGRLDLMGRVRGMQAVCRQLQGRWKESVKVARESQDLQLRSSRVTWDYAIMIWWEMMSASFAGQVDELVTRIPDALRDAESRGDVYAATSFRTHRSSWAWLGMDRPDVADAQVDIAEREWTPEGYQFQHWHMTYARSEVDLYRGTPRRSFEKLTKEWKLGRLLRQVRAVRADMLYTRGRLALSVADEDYRPGLLDLAASDGRALIREGMPWTVALGTLVLAGVASFRSPPEAARMLTEVESLFAAADMLIHVEVARTRRGELTGGRAGQELVASALENARMLGVKRPERFVQLLGPGKFIS